MQRSGSSWKLSPSLLFLIAAAATLTGCRWVGKPYGRAATHRTRTPKRAGTPDPQVDIGTFGVWQDDDYQNSNQQTAWVWRADGYDNVEVWLFWKLDNGGFTRPSNAVIGDTKRIDISYYSFSHYGKDNPLDDDDVAEFKKAISDNEGRPESELSTCRFIRGDMPGNTRLGLIKTGWYRVHQGTAATPPTAWIYEESDAAYAERWALRVPIDMSGGWRRPDDSNDPFNPVTIYIEYRGAAGLYADFLTAIQGNDGGNPTDRKYLDLIDAGVWP